MDIVNIVYNGNNLEVKKLDKFHWLTILDIFKEKGVYKVKCKCDCGAIVEKVVLRSLLCGNTKSCGCYNKKLQAQRNIKHGDSFRGKRTRLHRIWLDMRRRCSNQNRKDSKNYLEKGIRVCSEWDDFSVFKEWALENGYRDDLTIERKDNSKNYCPENCSWIPKSEQSKNRTTNHYITYNNETKTLTDWAKELGMSRSTLSNRLRKGWSVEKAFNTKITH